MVNELLIYVGIWFFIAFFLRLFVILSHFHYFLGGIQGDASVHFMIIKQLRKNPKSKKIDQFLIKKDNIAYPLIFHRFCSLFPLKLIKRFFFIPNLILFSLFTTLAFAYILFNFTSSSNTYFLFSLGFLFSMFLSPTNKYFGGDEVNYISLSERLMGRLCTGIYFLGLIQLTSSGDIIPLLVVLIFGTLAILSSKFATQVIVFVSFFISLLNYSILPIILIPAILILGIIFSKGYYLRILKHQLEHLVLYFKKIRKSLVKKESLSSNSNLKNIKSKARRLRTFFRKGPFSALLRFPEIYLIIFALLKYQSTIWTQLLPMLNVILATYIVYFLINFPCFKHLGESYRYIEYSLIFIFPASIGIILSQVGLDPIFLIALLIYSLYSIFVPGSLFGNIKGQKEDKLSNFLSKLNLPKKSVIYPIPMTLGPDICVRKDYYSFWWQPGAVTKKVFNEFIEEYPFPKKNFNKIFKKYKVEYIIVDIKQLKEKSLKYNFSKFKKIKENQEYVIYKVNISNLS